MSEMALPKPKPSKAVQQKLKVEKAAVYAKNKERVLSHLKNRGLRPEAIAALAANIEHETGGSYDFSQKQTRSGSPSDPRTIERGYGLFQFDNFKKNVGHKSWYKQYLKENNKKDNTESQLDYVLDTIYSKKEDKNYKYKKLTGSDHMDVLKAYLETNENPEIIAQEFEAYFEKAGIPHSSKRKKLASKIFEEVKPTEKLDTFPPERVFDVPEEKSMFERVKPYIPVVRHLNEGGAIPMERQMSMFDEGGLSTDEEFNEDLKGTFEITPEMQERMEDMTKEERDALRKKLVADAMERMLSKSPEKMDRSKFIQQYNEGGLEQDGGMIDPVSGNDVPPGSSKEEVRDDIPAQLSEGEFVFPADVVRYIGLEKLMQMRQEAKMGLKMMDEMGQMGNSEEATMPDDLPFDINDLDMDDEIDDNTQNFNVGGMPMPNQQAGVFFTPGTSGIATSPVQAASAQYQPNIAEPVRPQQAPVPTYQPREIPEYVPFIGGGAPNVEQETRQFINDEGNIINVIYNKATGEPLNEAEKAKITEGYKPYDPNAPKVEDTTVTPTQVQTATVTGEGGDDEARQRREEEMYGPGGGRLGVQGNIYGVSFDVGEGGILSGLKNRGSIISGLVFGGKIPEKIAGDVTVNFKRGETEFAVDGIDYNELKDVIQTYGANSPNAQRKVIELQNLSKAREDAIISSTQERGREVDALGEDVADTEGPGSGMAPQTLTAAEQKRADQREKERQRNRLTEMGLGDTPSDADDREASRRAAEASRAAARRASIAEASRNARLREEARVNRERDEQQRKAENVGEGGFAPSRPDPGGDKGGGGPGPGRGGSDPGGSGGYRAKGGLMEAPKPKPKKKMKRGGLASKK